MVLALHSQYRWQVTHLAVSDQSLVWSPKLNLNEGMDYAICAQHNYAVTVGLSGSTLFRSCMNSQCDGWLPPPPVWYLAQSASVQHPLRMLVKEETWCTVWAGSCVHGNLRFLEGWLCNTSWFLFENNHKRFFLKKDHWACTFWHTADLWSSCSPNKSNNFLDSRHDHVMKESQINSIWYDSGRSKGTAVCQVAGHPQLFRVD